MESPSASPAAATGLRVPGHLGATMRAGVVLPAGASSVEYRTDVPVPKVGARDVRVRVRYAALNRNDLGVIGQRGRFAGPTVIGSDGAGVVDSVGSEIDSVAVGAPVIILPTVAWGDDDNRPDEAMNLLGHPLPGTHAEYVVVPVGNVRPLPATWSFADAGALPLAGLTAWRALTRVGQLTAGENVLITGASGGVSTFLIDLARDLGATVYVTTSTDEKLDTAIAAGAAGGALHGDAAWPEHLREIVGGGIDLAVDSAGDLGSVLRTLDIAGRLVTLGRTAVRQAPVDVGEVFLRHLRILGTTMGSPRDFDALLRHVVTVPWRPRIDSVWPLNSYADAIDRLAGGHTGKILLNVSDGTDA